MAFPQGVDFRLTEAYRSGEDTGNNWCYPEPSGNNADYPQTTAQGNNVGWETATSGGGYQARNRSLTNDVRLAGMHYNNDTNPVDFRIDLASTGSKNIRVAFGEPNYAQSNQKAEVFDTSSSLGVLFSGASTGAANSYLDATGSVYTAANWPGSNSSVSKTFSTTIFRLRCGDGSTGGRVAHVYVEDGAAAAGQPTMARWNGIPGMVPGGQKFGRGW